MARASAKTSAIVIAVNILGAAVGFLPKALILANAAAAITPVGPRMQREKIKREVHHPVSLYIQANP